MKNSTIQIITSLALVSLLAGCYTPEGRPDYTANGALIGGASGAAIGAMADRRAPGAGALIGGAAGLLAGGLIGHGMDQDADARRAAATPPPPVYTAAPPSINDIKSMARSGVNDDVIIGQISSTRAIYTLDASTIIDLKSSGVSDKVVAFMINTSSQSVSQAPPAPQTEAVMVSPGPDYVWVGGEWAWNGAAWIWIGGRWTAPPYRHAVWVGPYWQRGPYGWRRVPGRWR